MGVWYQVPWKITLKSGRTFPQGIKEFTEEEAAELKRCKGPRVLTKAEAKREVAIATANAEAEAAAKGEPESQPEPKREKPSASAPNLDGMSKKDLAALAEEMGIKVSKRMNKEEVAAAIRDAS